jgi:hypothetical protein
MVFAESALEFENRNEAGALASTSKMMELGHAGLQAGRRVFLLN